jgi:para-aminobenzoate synthetase component I
MTADAFKNLMNGKIQAREPFVFAIDFEMQDHRLWDFTQVDPNEMLFNIDGASNAPFIDTKNVDTKLILHPESFEAYKKKFDVVMDHLAYGDSFLTNLTIKTRIETRADLRQLFAVSNAKYKLWVKNEFLVFSPETFIRIFNGFVYAYPMKGTIDASIPDAETKILADEKELAEHVTIVDLIRNDLSMIADHVEVTRFRYIDKITTAQKTLLQVSSEIRGILRDEFFDDPAGALLALLPAGSVSGAPKAKTVEVIKSAECAKRGFYTGICGFFDGSRLDTGVMIRFIEEHADGTLYYRSGGGITTQSTPGAEFREALDKIYVPVN